MSSYTHNTIDGKPETFSEFILHCAAGLPMFHELDGRPLPMYFEADDISGDQLERAREHFLELQAVTSDEWELRAWEYYDRTEQSRLAALAELTAQAARVEARLAEVRAWKPPTPEHDSLKLIMLEQLMPVLADCRRTSLEKPTPRLTGSVFKTLELKEARRALQICSARHREAAASAQNKTQWVEALRDSLEETAPATI